MTSKNLLTLARNGTIDLGRPFRDGGPTNYCVAASLDRLFQHTDVPASLYHLNNPSVSCAEEDSVSGAEQFYGQIGEILFKGMDNQEGLGYYFTNYGEFQTDLQNLRKAGCLILIDTMHGEGYHANGLEPVGDQDWRIVGIEDVICVYSETHGLDVQQVVTDNPTMTTQQVWEYMVANNPPDCLQSAYVFPPEPSDILNA